MWPHLGRHTWREPCYTYCIEAASSFYAKVVKSPLISLRKETKDLLRHAISLICEMGKHGIARLISRSVRLAVRRSALASLSNFLFASWIEQIAPLGCKCFQCFHFWHF